MTDLILRTRDGHEVCLGTPMESGSVAGFVKIPLANGKHRREHYTWSFEGRIDADVPSEHDVVNWPVTASNTVYGEGLTLTDAQADTVRRKWEQDPNGMTWAEFAATVHTTFHMDDAVAVRWSGMWIAIETDGHGHT